MKLFYCFAVLCCIILILSDQYQQSTALRKKKLFKKLKDLLPLLLALKGKKKLLVLPIPVPIKIGKHVRETWPAPAWPSAHHPLPPPPPPSHHQFSWPSSSIDFSGESWPSIPPQSSPPAKISHTYLSPEYVTDHNAVKSFEQYLTTYTIKDGPGSSYGLKGSNGGGYGLNYQHRPNLQSNYGRPQQISEIVENRRPHSLPPPPPPSRALNKGPAGKKPLFGQPLVIDEYENGKGTAAAYNDNVSNAPAKQADKNNRVQFKSVSGDYSGGSLDETNVGGGEYKSSNEINYEDNRLKSVSADYAGNQGEALNDAGYEENNELINENVKDVASSYSSNQVPAIRIPGYKKKAKV